MNAQTVITEPVRAEAAGTLTGVRVSIRTKIVLPYLFLAMILAMGAAYLITQIVFDSLEERFTNQLIESGKLSSEWFYREEERMLASLRLIANTSGVAEALAARQAEDLRNLTWGLVVENQEDAVEFLDSEGYLLLSMRHRAGGNIEEYDFARNGSNSFTEWEFIRKVVEQQPDAVSDKYSGLVLSQSGDTFYIAGPVFDSEGNRAGTLLVGKTLATITRQVREEILAQVSLYQLDGSVLYSSLPDPAALPPEKAGQVLAMQDSTSLSREVQMAHIDYQEIVGPWEVRSGDDIGLIGAALPKTFYLSPDRVTRTQIILLVGLTFFLVIVTGVNLAHFITRPLISLVQASSQVSKGNYNVQVVPTSNDEVAVLTQSFNQMVTSLHSSRNDLLHAYDTTLEGWSRALEMRDKETEGHTLRVTHMAVRLARLLGVEGEDLVNLQRGALLHDIGKMGIPDHILLKPGKLDAAEWIVMRQHPQFAHDMLWPNEYLRLSLEIPYSHHEFWDGSGYPQGLKGEQIPLAARIFAVVDVWDALRSDRPYKKAMSRAEALHVLRAESGTHFEPRIVDIFLANLDYIIEGPPESS